MGYLTKRFPVRDLLKKKNSISLEEALIELEEVTAYGVRKFYLRVPYTQISSMPVPLYSFAMVPCGNKLYVTGGDRSQVKPPTDYDLTGSGGLPTGFIYEKYSNRIYIYDITSNTWTVSGQKLRSVLIIRPFTMMGKSILWVGNVFQLIGRLSILMRR